MSVKKLRNKRKKKKEKRKGESNDIVSVVSQI